MTIGSVKRSTIIAQSQETRQNIDFDEAVMAAAILRDSTKEVKPKDCIASHILSNRGSKLKMLEKHLVEDVEMLQDHSISTNTQNRAFSLWAPSFFRLDGAQHTPLTKICFSMIDINSLS
ncbi:unnamed protein product [Albugo candida]|uniref:Uncharacterized protein n=1 Tax=Albugo candida TaxID=65357 RepID=A0A024G341_9STRA|nr:unnamed protein product [Albugo candida]|eukprot:CCI41268.1 unnamed protein product [Albugo candida]